MTYLEDLSKGLEVEGDVPCLLHRGDHVTEHRAAHSVDGGRCAFYVGVLAPIPPKRLFTNAPQSESHSTVN